MNTAELVRRIAESQADDGAFPSSIRGIGRDHNGFVTALVIRALGHGELPDLLATVRSKALDYIETCEDVSLAGSFRFWPAHQQPHWAKLPSDADDTAVMAVDLYRNGRRNLHWLRQVALRVLMRHRVPATEDPRPSWIRDGAMLTWLAVGGRNVVDAVVNTNVAALFAAAELPHISAYSSAVGLVDAASTWCEGSGKRVQIVAPFYPNPSEFIHALRFAVSTGARELQPSLVRMQKWFGLADSFDENQPVCSGAYSGVVWTAPVLQWAREFTRRACRLRVPPASRSF